MEKENESVTQLPYLLIKLFIVTFSQLGYQIYVTNIFQIKIDA